MRSISRNGIDLKKLSLMAILVNAVQIVSSVFIAAILLATPQLISDIMVQVLLIAVLLVTITGAIYDITEAVRARKLDSSHDMLEDSYKNLTYLNTEMRKQRHDFKNHLQVIYSLLELNEPNEAIAYIDRVNADLSHVQSSLKTIHPAVNALIAAKKNDADEAGIVFTLNVQTDLE
ncbi:MAG: Spo0B domain-containing protein, partial [Clostridia bacterium]|nr:Spo0B domain-containing protein [Clostridia bacterium]